REMLVKDLQNLSKLCQSLSTGPSGSFSTLGTQKQDQLKEGLTNLAQKAELFSKKVEKASNFPQSDLWSGLDYTDTLARVYGIDINELLGWYRDEVEERKQGLYALAEDIDSRRSPFQILEEDLAHYDSPKEMYQAMKNFLVVARKRSLDYLSLPDGETCEVWKVPEYLKDSYPWGGYYGKHPLRGELEGAVFLNQYNYQDLTEGWLELNAVHECYPGHHAHAVKTAAGDMPLSFKAVSALTSRAAPLTEGVAVRSEKLMQDIFEDDLFPLFVAYRRLHIAVRVWADLLLHYFDKGVESAVQLYRKYMHFSDKISREQVFSQQLTPGYFTVYCYGLKKLQRIQKDSTWTDPEFTELIFSSGKISLRTIQNLIRLSAEERDMLLNNFTETKTNF
ncbi:MAG: DUF885 family protein, partial [Deltaproteobacteria bacterium]|nr:DUF885 family protein [Deltaproteobacteria bacterium]